MPHTNENPGTQDSTGALFQADHERNTISPKCSAHGSPGQLDMLADPSHPDAIRLWPVLLPVYQSLLNSAIDLEAHYPRQALLCKRMADGLRDQMIDAELGMLNASPERRIAKRMKVRQGHGR